MFFRKKSPHCGACLVCQVVVAILLFLASVAALVGVYKSHVLSSGFAFGTTSGSLSLIAFAVSVTLWMSQMRNCVSKCEACGTK
jgi:hypothetical protein